MIFVLYTLHIIVCLFLILVILLQQGSGADLSVFGGGSTQAAFGARGATQLVHKLTVWGFVAFILLTLLIAVLQGGGSGSVVSGVDETPATEASAPPAAPAGAEAGETSENAAASTAAEGDAAAGATEGAGGPVEAPEPPAAGESGGDGGGS